MILPEFFNPLLIIQYVRSLWKSRKVTAADLSAGTNAAVAAGDTVVEAIAKLQKQIDNI